MNLMRRRQRRDVHSRSFARLPEPRHGPVCVCILRQYCSGWVSGRSQHTRHTPASPDTPAARAQSPAHNRVEQTSRAMSRSSFTKIVDTNAMRRMLPGAPLSLLVCFASTVHSVVEYPERKETVIDVKYSSATQYFCFQSRHWQA